MSNVKINGVSLENRYAYVTAMVKLKQDEIGFYIRYDEHGLRFKVNAYRDLKDVYKALDILRGFITDKRNYAEIHNTVKDRMNYYNNLLRESDNMEDIRDYFKYQDMGICILNAIAEKMNITEDVTKELRENLERNKEEAGVTE